MVCEARIANPHQPGLKVLGHGQECPCHVGLLLAFKRYPVFLFFNELVVEGVMQAL